MEEEEERYNMYVCCVCVHMFASCRTQQLVGMSFAGLEPTESNFLYVALRKIRAKFKQSFLLFFCLLFHSLAIFLFFSLSLSPYLNNSTIPTYDVIQLLLCCQVYISKILYYAVAWHFIFIQWHPYMLHKCCIVNGITSALQYGTIIELYLYYMWHEMVRPLSASFAWTIVWRI